MNEKLQEVEDKSAFDISLADAMKESLEDYPFEKTIVENS